MLGVAHVLGLMLAAFAATYTLPIIAGLMAEDGTVGQFILAALISAGVGLGLAAATRRHARELKPRDGFLLVTVGWVLMSASAAVPLLMLLPHLTFTKAFFETMSGLTTTGSTVLTGLDGLPPSINLWRATLHWCGGLGIIVLAVAVLPLLGVGGMQLYTAEAPGPVKDEKLTPRITETAKSLWLAYIAITAVGIVALRICGMSWFDAICHCFTAVGLGGFSTHDASIAYFDSPAIEMVLSALMIVASLSFTRHFVALRRLTLLLSRQAGRELKLLVHPSAVAPVRIGGRPIPERVVNSVLAFIFLYFMTAAVLTFALLATGLDFESSFGAVIASINNTGPGLGIVGPGKTYQGLSELQTWICIAAMLLGRLEFFSVLVLFTPAFWRK